MQNAKKIVDVMFAKTPGYQAFAVHRALQIHFQSSAYDFIKFKGKTNNNSPSNYLDFSAKAYYELVEEQIPKNDIFGYLFVNTAANPKAFISEIIRNESCKKKYITWQAKMQSLPHWLCEDVKTCFRPGASIGKQDFETALGLCSTGSTPKLFNQWVAKTISPESMVILDNLFDYRSAWKKQTWTAFHPLWKSTNFFLTKYESFFQVEDRENYVEKLESLIV